MEDSYEVLKKRFGNIGFKLDIRSMHTYSWPYFFTAGAGGRDFIWDSSTSRINFGRTFIGSYTCLYDSRQATHEQREKDNSWEGRSYYVFNPAYNGQNGLPPGTPLTTEVGVSTREVGGGKWEY